MKDTNYCATLLIGGWIAMGSEPIHAQSKPQPSDHFDGERFFNPENREVHGFADFLKMLLGTKREEWPEQVDNPPPNFRFSESLDENQVAVTFVNHSTMLIQMRGLNVLTDPVWSKRVSPVSWAGPARVRPPGIPFDELPEIDLVLVSHNHYDHLDLSTLKRLHERFAPRFLVAFGDKQLLESEGIDRVAEFDWWQGIDIDANTRVTFTPTQHFSSRSLWDRDKSLWGSYMIERGPHRIYFGGDAGYSSHYQSIRERIGAPTLAFLPIGAYEPRWFMKPMHMNPEEAVQAHRDLAAKRSIAIHFRCFQLTAEAMDQPVIDLKSALQAASLAEQDFVVLQEGRTEIFDL